MQASVLAQSCPVEKLWKVDGPYANAASIP
jgi:hypothetical protein